MLSEISQAQKDTYMRCPEQPNPQRQKAQYEWWRLGRKGNGSYCWLRAGFPSEKRKSSRDGGQFGPHNNMHVLNVMELEAQKWSTWQIFLLQWENAHFGPLNLHVSIQVPSEANLTISEEACQAPSTTGGELLSLNFVSSSLHSRNTYWGTLVTATVLEDETLKVFTIWKQKGTNRNCMFHED